MKFALSFLLVLPVWAQTIPPGGYSGGWQGLPPGGIMMILSGSCPALWTEVTALNGMTIIGTLAANGDVGTTGGSDTITPAGSVAAPVFSGSQGTSSAVSGGTPAGTNSAPAFTGTPGTVPAETISYPANVPTFTGNAFSGVINHTHNLVSTSFTPQLQGGTTAATTGTHIMTSTATGGSLRSAGEVTVAATPATGNPAGGVASITPAGTIAWPANPPTNGTVNFTPVGTVAAPVFTGSVLATHTHTLTPAGTNSVPGFTGNQFDNRSSFVKVIFCSRN